ncbi:hypothetical protein M2263_004638 [Providencia alcalifaciens]|nr:hypothetical protein [Providencia alcalifaciens]
MIRKFIKISAMLAFIFSASSYAATKKIECEYSQKVPDVEIDKKKSLWSLDFDKATPKANDKKTFIVELERITWVDPWGDEHTYFFQDIASPMKGYRILSGYSEHESNIERGIAYFEERKVLRESYHQNNEDFAIWRTGCEIFDEEM